MVGLAEIVVSRDPNLTLCTYPLGACLAIAIYDPVAKVGGLLHSLLPDSGIDPQRAAGRPGMFLDTGLAELLSRALELGATKENLWVFTAGGAQILDETAGFNIGKRNYEVLNLLLAQQGLNIRAQDVGGMTNRTMQLSLETGEVRLKFSGQVKLKLLCQKSPTT
ncbi:MAG: cheD [Pedosphaera sp.]|nr:cheD [Pedosphaera sp.]